MAKIRILFVLTNLSIGGVEKSLVELLKILPADKYDASVAAIRPEGGFREQLPENVRLLHLKSLDERFPLFSNTPRGLLGLLKAGALGRFTAASWHYAKAKLSGSLIGFYDYCLRDAAVDITEKFDIAVSFQGPAELLDYYVTEKIQAGLKYGWIHFDIRMVPHKRKSILRSYSLFDRVFIVSEEARKRFVESFPELAGRCRVFHNIISRDSIMAVSMEAESGFRKDAMNLLTVGRMHYYKGQDIAIEAAALLKRKGLKFRWHFVGDGATRESNIRLVRELGLEEEIVFHGAVSNPYPYMHDCDIYVQPSRHEGFCITLGEAKLFGMPIVSTDFAGAHEQLDDVENALIVRSAAPEDIFEAVLRAKDMERIADGVMSSCPPLHLLSEML